MAPTTGTPTEAEVADFARIRADIERAEREHEAAVLDKDNPDRLHRAKSALEAANAAYATRAANEAR